MMEGWVKIHRKMLNSQVWRNEGLLKVWVWCLLKANHKKAWVPVQIGKGSTEIEVDPGQFLFGRNTAARELNMKPSSVRNRIKKLKKMGNLDTQEDSHYTIISIVNWPCYQGSKNNLDNQKDSQRTARGQPEDTDKKDKKGKKNKEKDLFSKNSLEFRLSQLLLDLVLQRIDSVPLRKTDLQEWARYIDFMVRIDKRDPKEIEKVIRWAQGNSFWYKQIKSTKSLRKHFDTLRLQMVDEPKGQVPYHNELL